MFGMPVGPVPAALPSYLQSKGQKAVAVAVVPAVPVVPGPLPVPVPVVGVDGTSRSPPLRAP